MKNFPLKFGIVILIAATLTTECKPVKHEIVLKNDTNLARVDEPIVISRTDLEKHLGKISYGFVPMILSTDGDLVPSQVDDLNGDGNWDELFMLVNLPEESTITYQISLVDSELLPKFTQRSNVWLARPMEQGANQELIFAQRPNITRENHGQTKIYFQFEGPGWENDRVGFRNYFDERNGMDIFGKRTEAMVLQNVGVDEDYHVLQNWGMDILKVGTSLGAGSIAIEKDGKLHRVAPSSEGSYQLVSNGPLRSIFRFNFNNWNVDNEVLNIIHQISIHGGAWYYESNVSVLGSESEIKLVTGITTIDLDEKTYNFIDCQNGIFSLSTYGKQAIEGEYLGMAIMHADDSYKVVEYLDKNAEDITHTFIVRLKLYDDKPTSYRFYSAWELSDEKFANPTEFEKLLKDDALRMASPIRVQIQ
jgi:hypothetical protein